MCGIAGIVSPSHQPVSPEKDQEDIQRMADALKHRGPDGMGKWHNASRSIHLGHRRLAIIDTSDTGAQPMHYADRYSIVYNGELYNYRELRETLRAAGFQFTTASDTEVILAAFAHYREACLDHFDGMFAFAIWDELDQRLFIARDRFGEKPFFFHEEPGGRFLFASEMKALWAIGVPRQPDEQHILLFLATGQTAFPLASHQTSFKNIFQLPAASYAWMDRRSGSITLSSTKYWDIDTRREFQGGAEQAAAELYEKLAASVQLRLRSDVPVGCSLSGGLDSSSIAALANSDRNLGFQGFSAVFPGFEKDESQKIGAVCSALDIQSRLVNPTADDLVRSFEKLAWHQEEPIGSASVLAQFMVFGLAREFGVKVLLDGQGADEVLAGYSHYLPWYLQEKWRRGEWSGYWREKQLLKSHGQDVKMGGRNFLAALFPQAAQSQLIERQYQAILNLPLVNADYRAQFSSKELLFKPLVTHLNDLLYVDTTMGRLPELLRYADRNSMAHGCEVRLPFLQHNLVQWVYSLPSGYKVRDGFTKWVLRKCMEEQLPAEVTWQTGKIGFEPPQLAWMENEAVQERIRASRQKLVSEGVLDKKMLAAKINPASAHDPKNYDWRCWAIAALY